MSKNKHLISDIISNAYYQQIFLARYNFIRQEYFTVKLSLALVNSSEGMKKNQ